MSDTRAGIPEEMRERCSEAVLPPDKNKFQRKQAAAQAWGFTIVKHAVQYHHGTICVEGHARQRAPPFVLGLPAAWLFTAR